MPVQKPFWDYFWIEKYLFRAMGIIPLGGPSSLWKSVVTEVLTASQLVCVFLLIQPLEYILFRDHRVDDLFESVIILLATIATLFRSSFAAVNRRKFLRLFAECVKLWDSATPADYIVISRWAERVKLYSTVYVFLSQIIPEEFILTSTLRQLSLPDNSTIKYYPFGFDEHLTPSPEFEIKYILQVVCGHMAMAIISAVDIAGILVALLLCGQLDLIRSWLRNISAIDYNSGDEEIDDRVKAELKKCVKRHQLVMNLCTALEEAVRYINLTQVLTGMYIFAISGARLMKNMQSYRNYGPFVEAVIGFFLSCWPAETLISASIEVTRAVYDLPWYRYPPRERIAVAIMLARSQQPPQLTAGKFAMLSLKTFSSILCNGFSFCMVLNSF